MSSILKALKKLENDKKYIKPEQIGIDARILQERPSSRFSPTAAVLIAVALFVCGGGATYYYLRHTTNDRVPLQTSPSGREAMINPPVAPDIPPAVQERAQQKRPPLPVSSKPAITGDTQSRPRVVPPRAPQPPQPEQKHESVSGTAATRPVPAPSVPTDAASRPNLTINGIAFQDGGSDNLAVINGITVNVGTVIEGVRVEDIQKDRVRFSRGSEKFEILLNKSNR